MVGGYLRVKSKRQFRDTTWQIALSTVTRSSFADALQGLAIQQGQETCISSPGRARRRSALCPPLAGTWAHGPEAQRAISTGYVRVVDHHRSGRLTAAPADLWQWQFNLGQKRRGQLVRFGGDAAIGRSGDGGYVPQPDSAAHPRRQPAGVRGDRGVLGCRAIEVRQR